MWIDERLQIVAITTGGFVLKDNYVLDEEEYLLNIAVDILHPTVEVKSLKVCTDSCLYFDSGYVNL